jgi:hypothetical protein
VLMVFAAVALVIVLIAHRRGTLGRPGRMRAIVVVLLAALVLPAVAASAVNDATQTADLGRPAEDLTTAAVSRIVWSHVGEIRGDLPGVSPDWVSDAEAAALDSDYNTIGSLDHRLRELDGGGNAVANAAIGAALRCCALTIAGTVALDVVEFAFVPATFAYEGTHAVLSETPTPTATLWNITRMNQAHPRLTDLLLLVSWALLPLLGATVLAGRLRSGAPGSWRRDRAVLIIWLGTVLNGCVFAAAQGADANVRYGLSDALVLTCALAVWTLTSGRDPAAVEAGSGADRTAVVRHRREDDLVGSLASGA